MFDLLRDCVWLVFVRVGVCVLVCGLLVRNVLVSLFVNYCAVLYELLLCVSVCVCPCVCVFACCEYVFCLCFIV